MSDFDAKTGRSATLKSMDYLARRDHSEKELRQKLGRHFASEYVNHAIAYCQREGWMSPPAELTERVIESLNRKLKSHFFIQSFLRKKGLPEAPYDSEIEVEKARAWIRKRRMENADRKRLYSLLKNRGFDTQTMQKVIHDILRNS